MHNTNMKNVSDTTATSAGSLGRAARGTAVLVLCQGCFFTLGYLSVVLLARELGPKLYATYGVIMSVLVWMEQSGKFAIPSATAKLLAETAEDRKELERSSLALNLGVYSSFFVLLWLAAPWLESWLRIDKGTFLFLLAAIDLPLFGVYTALQATHQGHQRFLRLGISSVVYALSKFVGVVVIVQLGLSLERALLVNAFSTLGGVLFLLPGAQLGGKRQWLRHVFPILSIATPMALYSFSLLLMGTLSLWILQAMSSAAEAAQVGVFVAALNVARIPGFLFMAIGTVLLPSVAKAVSVNNIVLVRQYIYQALRFFLSSTFRSVSC
jgi:O-antigen/teichoic acid export membrane protein